MKSLERKQLAAENAHRATEKADKARQEADEDARKVDELVARRKIVKKDRADSIRRSTVCSKVALRVVRAHELSISGGTKSASTSTRSTDLHSQAVGTRCHSGT